MRLLQLWYHLDAAWLTDTRPSIAAAILAGGLARRMGGANKAGLRSATERIIDRSCGCSARSPTRCSSSRPERRLLRTSDGGRARCVAGAGPLGGIYTALIASPRERTLIVGCDLPFLTLPLLQRLAAPATADLVIPRTQRGYEPLCATWSAACAGVLRRRIEAEIEDRARRGRIARRGNRAGSPGVLRSARPALCERQHAA